MIVEIGAYSLALALALSLAQALLSGLGRLRRSTVLARTCFCLWMRPPQPPSRARSMALSSSLT